MQIETSGNDCSQTTNMSILIVANLFRYKMSTFVFVKMLVLCVLFRPVKSRN
jgi:hypothetical protein